MKDPTKITETDTAGTGNAGGEAKTAGAETTAPAAAAAKKAKAAAAASPEPTIVVTGPQKGRWRIGRHFTREPVSIPLGDLTADERWALQADPELFVQIIDAPH